MLIGASSTYNVKSTGGSTEVPYHRHSISKVTDGATSKTLIGTTNFLANSSGSEIMYGTSGILAKTIKAGDASSTVTVSGNAVKMTRITLTATHSHDVAAHNTDYIGIEGNNNLPPYYAVYIWERTA